MLTERLKKLGLTQYLGLTGEDYQRQMGARLRAMVFQYLQGTLTDNQGKAFPDGPAVIKLRKNLYAVGGMEYFVRTQSPNKAWATDIELTLLAEVLGVNFGVHYDSNQRTSILSESYLAERPTVILANTGNVAWDAVIGGKKDRTTKHDGNCGYHAFANAIIAEAQSQEQKLENTLQKQDLNFRAEPVYQKEASQFHKAYNRLKQENPQEYQRKMQQIDSDSQLALRIYLNDLPGVQGRPSQPSVNPWNLLSSKGSGRKTAQEPEAKPAPQFHFGAVR